MLNEDKIKLMTSISMLEKKEGKYLFPVRQYFRSDYIGKNLLKALIGYTFCWEVPSYCCTGQKTCFPYWILSR